MAKIMPEWGSAGKVIKLMIEIILITVTFSIMLHRVRYGIEFSDESWYVAEPYVVAEKGAVPFVNNVSQAPAFTIPLALAYKIFCVINGGTEGIVLFSRYLFLIVALFTALIALFIVNRYTDFKAPLIAAIPLFLASCIGSLFDIDYNTVGLIYLPLIIALVYAQYDDDSKKSIWWGFIAGTVAVRATMGTIQVIVGLCVIFLSLCLDKKWKRIKGILIGCVTLCLIMFGLIGIRHGFGSLIAWIEMYLNQGYFMMVDVKDISAIKDPLITLGKYACAVAFFLGVFRVLIKNDVIFDFFLKLMVFGLIALGAFLTYRFSDYEGIMISFFTWFMPYLYVIYSVKRNKYSKHIISVCLAYLCIYLISSHSNHFGFGYGRAYWLIAPILFLLVLIFNELYDNTGLTVSLERGRKILLYAGIFCSFLVLSVFKIWSSYHYVYRDDSISLLTNKVDSGIWKGLYTTELRANNVTNVEEYLKSITNEEDEVLCLDWVSFGYLMTNGRICSPTTLDASPYTYKINTPNPYFMYFAVEDKVPNKIIYINYGRDEVVSIDYPEWRFNKFVNAYYTCEDSYSNEIFDVREYVVSDYSGALRNAKDNAVFK